MNKLKNVLLLIFCSTMLVAMLCYAQQMRNGIEIGLSICSRIIIPSLFFNIVICCFMQRSGLLEWLAKYCSSVSRLLFRLPGIAVPTLLISMLAGYPVGAKLCNSYFSDGILNMNQAKKLSLFCVSGGPSFVVIAVGMGMLGSKEIGWLLLCAHIASTISVALITGIVYKSKSNEYTTQRISRNNNQADAFVTAVNDAVSALMVICSYTVLFSAVLSMLSCVTDNRLFLCSFSVLLEVSNGVAAICACKGGIYIVSFALGFGGLSVILQILTCSKLLKPSFLEVTAMRILHGIISVGFSILFMHIFKLKETVFLGTNQPLPRPFSENITLSVVLILTVTVFISSIYQKYLKRIVDFF